MSPDTPIAGFVAPGFEAVRDAFATDPRGGSALTILRGGEPVVDLHEGWRDAARTRPWEENTLVNVYSVGPHRRPAPPRNGRRAPSRPSTR
jgi:hypothetical protein